MNTTLINPAMSDMYALSKKYEQAERIAKVRSLPIEKIQQLVAAHTDKADFGLFGVDGVNVLQLNLAMDALAPDKP